MTRAFSPVGMIKISDDMKARALEINYIGDISDLGNEVGKIVSEYYQNMSQEEIDSFIDGFKHGTTLKSK